MKIRYNIAPGKKSDALKLTALLLCVLLVSSFFFFVGMNKFKSNRRIYQAEISQLNEYKIRLKDLSEMSSKFQQEIEVIKKRWSRRINYVNLLINFKNFSYLRLLDKLEQTLPERVFATHLSTGVESGSTVDVNLAAGSLDDLFRAYTQLTKYFSRFIKNEERLPDYYRAQLRLTEKDENK